VSALTRSGAVVIGIWRAGDADRRSGRRIPCTVRRTISVPAESVGTLDFDITAQERDALSNRGLHAAQQFLETGDYPEYLRACGGAPTPATEV